MYKPKKDRPVRALTAVSLDRSAKYQLGRRSMSREELRRMLDRKAMRVARVLGPNPDVAGWIEAILDRVVSSGLVDDAKVARGRLTTGRAQGRSKRALGAKLRQQGVDGELVSETLVTVDEDSGHEDPELSAALVWARKKGLLRKDEKKALGALARQGFSYGIAKRALEQLASDVAICD